MSSESAGSVSAPLGRETDRVETVAAAVMACPLVAELHGGRYGQVATYLPGRRVTGIRRTEDELSVHVVAFYPAAMTAVADQVRSAVADFADDLPVAVTIEDLQLPAESESESADSGGDHAMSG